MIYVTMPANNLNALSEKKQIDSFIFITDGMLEGLLKWLRFLGFNAIRKQELGERSPHLRYREAVFLTTSNKNWEAWDKSPKILLKSQTPEGQLKELDERLKIFNFINFLSRCSVCNILLEKVEKNMVREQVPEKIFRNFSEFYRCPRCNRIYWEGGHVKRLLDKLNRMGISLPKREENLR